MASNTPLLPGVNHFISLEKAKEMTALFRAQKENILDPAYRGKNILSICETFNRDIFDAILAETGCVAMRIYFGMDPDLKVKVILVGVNEKNQDILPTSSTISAENDDDPVPIGEIGAPCPDFCPEPPL